MASAADGMVLVTGASGYIAGALVNDLLAKGYQVRGTVRSLKDEKKTAHLRRMAEEHKAKLELVEADLMSDQGWAEAVKGCAGVFHTASPFLKEAVEDEQELIRPAVDGTLRVLRAVAASNVASKQNPDLPRIKRVVLTSSVATLPEFDNRPTTEEDWADEKTASPYPKSKLLAEKAAWDFTKKLSDDEKFDLVTILPGLVLGPAVGPTLSTSIYIIQRIMIRQDPGSTALGFGCVDVRDVSIAHVLAYENPAAAGNRYIVSGQGFWHYDFADILKSEFGDKGYNIATWRIPYFLLWTASTCDKSLKLVVSRFNKMPNYDHSKSVNQLGLKYRDGRQTVIETAYGLIEHGLIPNKLPKK